MYCANCGVKIDDGQKFCHVCGYNVSSGSVPADDDCSASEDEEYEDDDEEESLLREWFYNLLPYLIIAALLMILSPAEYKVKSEVAHELVSKVSDRVGDYLGVGGFGEIFDGDSLDDDEAIELVERFGTISVRNFVLFKVAYFKPVNKKKERFVAIGVCGFVITP